MVTLVIPLFGCLMRTSFPFILVDRGGRWEEYTSLCGVFQATIATTHKFNYAAAAVLLPSCCRLAAVLLPSCCRLAAVLLQKLFSLPAVRTAQSTIPRQHHLFITMVVVLPSCRFKESSFSAGPAPSEGGNTAVRFWRPTPRAECIWIASW
jgi:hypothetical protein